MPPPHPPRRRPLSRAARLGVVAVVALTGLQLVRTAVRGASRPPPGTLAAPLIQRTMVPDLHVALQGVLHGQGSATAVAVLDCRDERWASVWAGAGKAAVTVDRVVCIDFSGEPDAGDCVDGASAIVAPRPSSVPWLHGRSGQVDVAHAPRGGAVTASAKLAASLGGRKGGARPPPSPPSSLPRTVLALASPDGQAVPARYATLLMSMGAAASSPRLILLDAGNTHAPDGTPTSTKKPRASGFQVISSSPPVHAFYALAVNTVQGTFSHVYDTQLWGKDGGGSGTGSSLAATASLRASLVDLIAKYKVKSFLDSSCGSMHWMPLVAKAAHAADPEFTFTGSDAVCSLIKSHKTTFAADSSWMDFACVDGSHEPLPTGRDLIFSRDSLQHLPIASAYKFLHNVRRSGAKYLLVGSYLTGGQRVTGGRNDDIEAGEVYDIDLLKPPFNLRPAPLEIIKEDNPEQKFMLLLDVGRREWDEDLGLT